jgi:hypothetical protein
MEQQQTYYPETTRSQQDYDSKQRRFDLTELQEEYNAKPVPFIRVDSAITVTRKKPITIDLERSIFLPGQIIHGRAPKSQKPFFFSLHNHDLIMHLL